MTISSTSRKAGPYQGNGATVAFPFAFKVFSGSDVMVVKTDPFGFDATLTSGTDYTVAINADQENAPGGTVTCTVAPLTGYQIVVTSALANLQPVQLTNLGGFYPDVVNIALDRLTILIQQVAEQASRAFKVGIASGIDPSNLLNTINASVGSAVSSATSASASAGSANTSAVAAQAAAAYINGFAYMGSWVTSSAYVKNNLVQTGGSSYICLVAHTSGVFATDYSAGKWALFAAQGSPGAGTGDMLAANNLNDVASKPAARSNLGLGTAAQKDTGTAAGQVVLLDGAAKLPAVDGSQLTNLPPVLNPGALTALSGSQTVITGIPASAKAILIGINGLNSSQGWEIQLGSGSLKTSGYNGRTGFEGSSTSSVASTTGFVQAGDAGHPFYGMAILMLVDPANNVWACMGNVGTTALWAFNFSGTVQLGSGNILDRIGFVAMSGGAFSAGSVNLIRMS